MVSGTKGRRCRRELRPGAGRQFLNLKLRQEPASRWTVWGEKAGRQIARYSAPSEPGVLRLSFRLYSSERPALHSASIGPHFNQRIVTLSLVLNCLAPAPVIEGRTFSLRPLPPCVRRR